MRFGMQLRFGLLAALVAGSLIPAGCTRRFFRQQADREVEEVLTEKDRDPWKIENWHVYPDPLARFADPSNPDRPPMPFDDPATQRLSPNPQRPGSAGCGDTEGTGYLELIKTWDAINRSNADGAAPPQPMSSALPPAAQFGTDHARALRSDAQPYLLTYDQACELAILNSRSFQDRREDLYLAALPVTLQRFSFVAQFFAGESFFREWAGDNTIDPGNRWGMTTAASMSKLFPTGALLLAQFANRLVIEMSGTAPKRVTLPSTASLDLTQPLLQGGGRAVTLEPLTQSERDLLYTVRAFARFRKLFHVDVAARGDLFATVPGGGFIAQRLTLSGQAPAQGYLPTLLSAALTTNRRNNVSELERIITFYRQLQGGGDVSPLQTSQVENQLLNSRVQLLQQEQDLIDGLDRFKLQLGVPTDLPLELDDGPIRSLTQQLLKLRSIFDQDRALQQLVSPLSQMDPAALRAEFRKRMTDVPLVQDTPFAQTVLARFAVWEQLTTEALNERLQRVADERRQLLELQAETETQGRIFSEENLNKLADVTFDLDLGLFEHGLRGFTAKPWERMFVDQPEPLRKELQDRARQDSFRRLFDLFVRLMGTARDQRLQMIKDGWPAVPRACVDGVDLLAADLDTAQTVASQWALTNRLDLMNARAQLVDAWRQIAVQANSLFGVVDVQYHLDTGNDPFGSNPLGFQTGRTRQFLSLNTELPLTRQLERNNFRTALIAYQRQRRLLQASEDQVVLEARTGLRALRVQAENYKIQQRAVPVAYSQRDNALETLRVPNPPGQTSSAGNAAALTQQLLGAQSTVLQNENQLYSFYINYLITRLQLYRDLELMPIDPRGVWIDEHTARDCENCVRPVVESPRPDADERLPAPRAVESPAPPPAPGQN
jgi:hypothetical protein